MRLHLFGMLKRATVFVRKLRAVMVVVQGVTYEQLPIQVSAEYKDLYNRSCAVWLEVQH